MSLYNSRRNIVRPLRLVAQDTGFSSQQQGFDSPRGRHYSSYRFDFLRLFLKTRAGLSNSVRLFKFETSNSTSHDQLPLVSYELNP